MERFFFEAAAFVALGLQALAVLVIAIGGLEAGIGTLLVLVPGKSALVTQRRVWLNFARRLILGLEFTLAADVVGTAISPSWTDIGRLAAIALIRTFLNYFLQRDLESARQWNEL